MISTAICTYNRELNIEEQLASILKQSMKGDEIVIYDEGSAGGTIDLVREYAEKLSRFYSSTINEFSNSYSIL